MDAGNFNRRIKQTITLLSEELGFTRTVSSLASLPVNASFNTVALDVNASYADIYISAASLSYYNVMMLDYSLFQFSWDADKSWRLAFLPNPWISGVANAKSIMSEWEAMLECGNLGDNELASLLDELPVQSSIPPLRFEYSVGQYRETAHPAAHFHIGRHTENRWALSRPLEPLTFVLNILRLYYREVWDKRSCFFGYGGNDCLDERFIIELKKMPVVHEFSSNERQSLHFSSQ